MRNATQPKRTVRVDLTLSPDELNRIQERAALVRMPVARYLREAGLALPLPTVIVDEARVAGLVAVQTWVVQELDRILRLIPDSGLLLEDETEMVRLGIRAVSKRLAPGSHP